MLAALAKAAVSSEASVGQIFSSLLTQSRGKGGTEGLLPKPGSSWVIKKIAMRASES
jgi:hypothetical protein